jgi:hypothetical protein
VIGHTAPPPPYLLPRGSCRPPPPLFVARVRLHSRPPAAVVPSTVCRRCSTQARESERERGVRVKPPLPPPQRLARSCRLRPRRPSPCVAPYPRSRDAALRARSVDERFIAVRLDPASARRARVKPPSLPQRLARGRRPRHRCPSLRVAPSTRSRNAAFRARLLAERFQGIRQGSERAIVPSLNRWKSRGLRSVHRPSVHRARALLPPAVCPSTAGLSADYGPSSDRASVR